MENSCDGEHNSETLKNEGGSDLQENVNSEKDTGTDNGTESSSFDFTENSWRSDFVLMVEGTKLYVARNILALASPVFDRMFQSDFKEKSGDELELPGKKKEQFVEFLRFIYPNAPARFACDTARNILPLADEYQVMNLKSRCEDALIESLNADTPALDIFTLLRDACIYDLQKLREKCVTFVTERQQKDLYEAKKECHIPAGAWTEVLERVNEKLTIKTRQLEDANKSMSREIETLRLGALEELKILKEYLKADAKGSKDLGLDGDKNWRSEQHILIADIKDKGIVAEKNIVMWDVPLKISLSVSNSLNLKIEKECGKIDCDFVIKALLICRQPRGNNETLKFRDSFSWLRQSLSVGLKKIIEINGIRQGFVRDDKIGLILQIYMSEPNR